MALLVSPLINTKKVWTRQPQVVTGINWGNPLANGLAVLVTPIAGVLTEFVAKQFPSGYSMTIRPGSNGLSSASNGSQYAFFPYNKNYDVAGSITIASIVDVDALVNYNCLVSRYAGGGFANLPYELRIGAAATDARIEFVRSNASEHHAWDALSVGSNTLAAGKNQFVAVSQASAIDTSPIFYVNSTKYPSPVSPGGNGTGAATSNSQLLYIGNRGDAITPLSGAINILAIWSRVLSDTEILSFKQNPWQLFAPLPTPKFSIAAGRQQISARESVMLPASGPSAPTAGLVSVGKHQAGIEKYLKLWRTRQPAFLWAPTNPSNLLLDQAGGLTGKLVGANVLPGGIVNPIANANTNYIQFATNLGISSNTDGYIGIALITIIDPTAVTGQFVKIGNLSSGIGYGAGNTAFSDSGSKMISVYEVIRWNTGAGSAFGKGLNVVTFGNTSDGVCSFTNQTTAGGVDDNFTYQSIAPTAVLQIAGGDTSRGTNVKIHAVAIYHKSLSNANFVPERSLLASPFIPLYGKARGEIDQLFAPQPQLTWGAR